MPKVGKTHTGTLPETEIPKPRIPKSEIPKTGIPKAETPELGIPKTGRFTVPLIQTPLRLPLNLLSRNSRIMLWKVCYGKFCYGKCWLDAFYYLPPPPWRSPSLR